MSNYYTALVSNEGLDAIRSDFKILIKADNLHKARAGAAAKILTVERATDQEIFEAGRNGNVVLNLSDVTTDDDQHTLPLDGGQTHAVDMTQTSAHDSTVAVEPTLVGATKSGSAPGWLQEATASANTPATDTGD